MGLASQVAHGRLGRARLIAMLAGAAVCVAATSCSSGPPGGVPGAGTEAPPITILTHGGNNGNGDIFLAPEGGGYQNGPEIITNTGRVVWFHPLPAGEIATDFRTQTYLGQPVLTWFQGGGGPGGGTDEIYNDRYQPMATVRAATVRLDLQTHVATLIKSDNQPEGLVAGVMGNAQTTRNGDLFVGWGNLPYISEFSPSGKLLFNAELPAGIATYRAYRLPWTPGV